MYVSNYVCIYVYTYVCDNACINAYSYNFLLEDVILMLLVAEVLLFSCECVLLWKCYYQHLIDLDVHYLCFYGNRISEPYC